MSLLHPTPGEIQDRLSILKLKIASMDTSKPATVMLIREEEELINHFFRSFVWKKKAKLLIEELWKCNSLIWKCEDSVRSTGDDTPQHIAIVAKRIAYLNDERNRLIREIDKAYGCENPVEEKIYSEGSRQ